MKQSFGPKHPSIGMALDNWAELLEAKVRVEGMV